VAASGVEEQSQPDSLVEVIAGEIDITGRVRLRQPPKGSST